MSARAWVGHAALAALAVLAVLIAAAGPEAVPAAGRGSDPGWVRGIFGDGLGTDGEALIWLERAALVAYAAVLVCARAISARVIGGAIAALVALFTLAPPLLSLDVFSYASYARLDVLHGHNPYEVAPSAVPGDEALAYVEDWRHSVSVYGPLFTLITWPLAHLGLAGAVWSLKALAGVAVVATASVTALLAALRGVDPRFAASLVALNPLVLVHVVGGAHNDAVMAALMAFSIAAVLLAREAIGGAGLVAATAIKAPTLLAVPFAALGSERPRRLVAGLVAGTVALVAVGLLAFGGAIDEAAKVIGQNQGLTSRASVPGTVSRELGLDLDAVKGVCLAALAVVLAALLLWTARGGDWIRAVGWAFLSLLLATSYLTPWYAIWALPAAAIARDRALAVGTVIVSAYLLRFQVAGLGG